MNKFCFYFSLYFGNKIRDYLFGLVPVRVGEEKLIIEPVKKEKGNLFISPHYSAKDIFVMSKIARYLKIENPFYIAKEELSPLYSLIGGIRILRKEDLKNIKKSERLKKIFETKEKICGFSKLALYKANLVMFPEGRRKEEPLKIKLGIFKYLKEEIENKEVSVYFVGFDRNYKLVYGNYIDNCTNLKELIEKINYLIYLSKKDIGKLYKELLNKNL